MEQSLIEEKGKVSDSQIVYSPLDIVSGLPDEVESNLHKLIDELETNEDVYRVWHTLYIKYEKRTNTRYGPIIYLQAIGPPTRDYSRYPC